MSQLTQGTAEKIRYVLTGLLVLGLLSLISPVWSKSLVVKIPRAGVSVEDDIVISETDKAFVEAQTGIRFPENLGSLHIRRTEDYRHVDPGLGQAVFYRSPGVVVTIYVYNRGRERVGGGLTDTETISAFRAAIGEVYDQEEMGYYQNVMAIEPKSIKLDSRTGQQEFLWTRFAYTEIGPDSDEDLESWLFVTGYRNHFFKVRYSASRSLFEDEGPGMALLDEFLVDLGRLFE